MKKMAQKVTRIICGIYEKKMNLKTIVEERYNSRCTLLIF